MSCSKLPATKPRLSALFKAAYNNESKAILVIDWRAHGVESQPCYRHGDIKGVGLQ